MKVLFLHSHSYFPERFGGAESSTHELALGLKEKGHDVLLLAALAGIGARGFWLRLRRRFAPGRRYSTDRWMGYRVRRTYEPAGAFADTLRDFAPDAVVITGIDGAYGFAKQLIDLDCPTLYMVRDVNFVSQGPDALFSLPMRFVSNSKFVAERLFQQFGVGSEVLYPPVKLGKAKGPAAPEFVTLFNPRVKKGGEILLALARHMPDIQFEVVEVWSPDEAVVRLKAEASRMGNILWSKPKRDVHEFYARSRLLLVPSQWEEPWGRVVTEAQSFGIPVLASNCGGLPESVGPGGQLVDDFKNPIAWEQQLRSLLSNPSELSRLSALAKFHGSRPGIQHETILGNFESLLIKAAS